MSAIGTLTALEQRIYESFLKHRSNQLVAAEVGCAIRTVYEMRKRIEAKTGVKLDCAKPKVAERQDIHVTPPPVSGTTIADILSHKRKIFADQLAHKERRRLIQVKVKRPGPFGIVVYGDPHVDDDGCDIGRLESDLAVISRDNYMLGINIGDLTNRWTGRLMRLYANQTTTLEQARELIEWMLHGRNWLAVILGNHDLWENGADVIKWATKDSGSAVESHGVRMQLNFPDGAPPMRIHARHDFPGGSQYNPTHGLAKELLWGFRDHLLLAGHRHIDHYQLIANPGEDFPSHLARVSGYKVVDDYADQGHLRENRFAPAVAFVVQPNHPVPVERLKPYWDLEAAADFVAFLRKRKTA